ncbi:DNA-directed RNA polymerase subunit alpha [Spiroplasma endosymbiont of Crioceris asparagi]|uniref:DNA-directed RNA polymerase subunit alpha n=1 Tax=Spiroplasma endosymbiont of Crioceris asparagi TaxID=3066286 RepID=UPI0030D07BAD
MKQFTRPELKMTENVIQKNYGEFKIEPLERGFGITLGNALRRTLISSTPGAAIYAIKITGANHEFSGINGIVENTSRIVLNVKKIVLKIDANMFEDGEVAKLTLNSSKEGVVKAGDIECPAGVEILNKDQVICNIADGGVLEMILQAKNSRGYSSFKENKKEKLEIGSITIDSNYSPIVNVSYDIESTNIGKAMDFESLILKITTDGSISPSEAISIASKIIIDHLTVFMELTENVKNLETLGVEKDEDEKELDRLIEDLDFTQRSLNCLKRANVNTLRDLVEKTEYDIQEIRNLGKKSLKEIKDKVAQLGLTFKTI